MHALRSAPRPFADTERARVLRALAGAAALAGGCGAARLPEVVDPGPAVAMPGEVRALLERRCAGCHVAGARDQAGWGSVLDVPAMIEARILVPGAPGASPLIGQLVAGEMPRRGQPLWPGEIRLLARWIAALEAAPAPPDPRAERLPTTAPRSKDREPRALAGQVPASRSPE